MPSEELRIDAKLKEIDATIADLQRQRRELLAAKSSLGKKSSAEVTVGEADSSQQETAGFSEKALEKAFNMLEWKEFKKKEGEWAFLRTRDGGLVEDLQPIVGFIDQLRKGKRVAVGKYDYVVSEDKFLNRYPGEHRS